MIHRGAAVSFLLAATLVLSGCATAPAVEPAPTPTTSVPTPTPAASASVRVIEPGERPPELLDGDCQAAVSIAELSDALEVEVTSFEQRDPRWTGPVTGTGGLSCEWRAESAAGMIEILPKIGVNGAQFPAVDEHYYSVRCEWACSWRYETEELWIAGYIDSGEVDRANVDARGQAIGSRIAASDQILTRLSWQRDTTGWWVPQDCTARRQPGRDAATRSAGCGGRPP